MPNETRYTFDTATDTELQRLNNALRAESAVISGETPTDATIITPAVNTPLDATLAATTAAIKAHTLAMGNIPLGKPLTQKTVTAGSVAVRDAAEMTPISLKARFLPRRSSGIPAEVSSFSLRYAGKNLADPATVEGKGGTSVTATYDAAADSVRVVSTGSNAYGYVSIYLRADTTYTFRAYLQVDSGNARFVLRRGNNGGGGGVMPGTSAATTESGYKTFTFTPEDTATYALCMYSTYGSSASSGDVTFSEIQCEVGESATAYEKAQNVRTVSIPFNTVSDNTSVAIRAGELELTTGVLTKTWEYMAQYDGSALPGDWITADGEPPVVGQPVAYELATPVTYQLTPLDYKLLRGANTVWNGYSGDSTALTYYVDDIMMLQAQIDELRALALENNG